MYQLDGVFEPWTSSEWKAPGFYVNASRFCFGMSELSSEDFRWMTVDTSSKAPFETAVNSQTAVSWAAAPFSYISGGNFSLIRKQSLKTDCSENAKKINAVHRPLSGMRKPNCLKILEANFPDNRTSYQWSENSIPEPSLFSILFVVGKRCNPWERTSLSSIYSLVL